MISSGPAALSERSFLSCSLISSRVGRMLSCGSGMCESEGWGASKFACTRMASSSSQGESGCTGKSWPRSYLFWWYPCLPSAGSLLMWSGHHSLLSIDLFVRICEGSCDLPAASWICSCGGVARLCS